MEGTIVGQYRIVRKIGAGGMGVVYLAEHTLVGRRAAIKVLLPEYSVKRVIVDRFFNEARAMTAIPDPGIVQMYDFGFHSDGSAFIVMEFLEGETLDRRIKRRGRIAVVEALRLTRQIAGALATAHAAGIIHRDLKPENVMVVRDAEALGGERAKVLDFGVAKLSGATDRSQTMAGSMMGTPAYMSPEQCRGAGQVDGRADIYSLGCVMMCLITGRLAFDREGVGELISAHMHDAPEPPSARVADVPAEVDALVLRCLEKSADARFQTMLELQAACDALLGRLSVGDPGASASAMLSAAFAATSSSGYPLPSGFRSGAPAARPPSMPSGELLASREPAPNATTLSSLAGVTQPSVHARPRRLGVWLGVAGVVIVAGVGLVIAMTSGKQLQVPANAVPAAQPAPAAAPAPTPALVVPPVAAPAIATDAGVAAAPSDAALAAPSAPAAAPSPAVPTSKPKPKLRKPPNAPHADDLYDDR
jgi:serine/threonine-protein kinase